MKSCIYRGNVRHRRFRPREHAFRYPLFMMYLDLAELPGVFDGRAMWSARRPAPAWFRRADYLGNADVPLDEAVRGLVQEKSGERPTGPIRLLTHLRYFGCMMNPVSFYYCFDATGNIVETIVAEITNTPWGERHAYVLGAHENRGTGDRKRYRLNKEFHVSPFIGMDMNYDWRFTEPGRRLVVHMENLTDEGKLFDATLVLQRESMSPRALRSALLRHPFMTARVTSAIYWQALRLHLKRTPFYAHPAKSGR
jgi:DUF1365 family protein